MKRIIAFGASNSRQSINKQFAEWAVGQMDVHADILDLNDFEMPIYSIDREQDEGVPSAATQFKEILQQADGIIISFAEHNGSYSTAFKNVFDWISRLEKPIWSNKPMLLLATSPGPRGAKGVLTTASGSFPHQGGQVTGTFSLPSFHQKFDLNEGITDAELMSEFREQLIEFKKVIDQVSNETVTRHA